jgi:PAS domain S-box-containing protein
VENNTEILIVEDSPTQAAQLQFLLEENEYIVSIAPNGSEALTHIKGQKPAAIISDIVMPVMDGYEMCRIIKDDVHLKDVPVLLLTRLTDSEDIILGLEARADAYVTKPYDESELLSRIELLISNPAYEREDESEIQFSYAGKPHVIRSNRQQMLSLLLFVYENAIQQNEELHEMQTELNMLNNQLEQRVGVRTAELSNANSYLVEEIAERKRVEMELLESEKRYRQLVENAQEGIWVIDLEEKTTLVNARMAEMLGYTIIEMLGRSLLSFMDEQGVDIYKRNVVHRRQHDTKVAQKNDIDLNKYHLERRKQHDYELCHKNGKKVYTRMATSFLADDEGNCMGTFAFVSDVTEHREIEQKLQVQRERAVQSDRLRSLGEMAAGVAHELNQPLSGVRTFSEALVYRMKSGMDISQEKVEETLEDIVVQVDRMTEIIDHMRAFSRDRTGQPPEIFHIEESIKNVLKLVGEQLRVHGIEVRIDVPDGLPECNGWLHQIEQVLVNLISNARDAMETFAGQIKKKAVEADADWKPVLEIRVSCISEPDRIRVDVSDTGGGVPEPILHRIFDPFFTSKEVGKGTGLGLSISRNMMDKHKGSLEVNNRLGEGATFSLLLPIQVGGTSHAS